MYTLEDPQFNSYKNSLHFKIHKLIKPAEAQSARPFTLFPTPFLEPEKLRTALCYD